MSSSDFRGDMFSVQLHNKLLQARASIKTKTAFKHLNSVIWY